MEQQFWLYLYGMLVAGAVHIVSATNTTFGSMAAGLGQAGQNVQVMTTFKIVLVTKHHLCMVADLGQAGQNV